MMYDFPTFEHVNYINDRPAPRFDLAKSNITPDWKGVIDAAFDISYVGASDPKGLKELRVHLGEVYGVGPDRIVLTNGTSEANWLTYLSLVSPESRVLIEKPIYTPILEVPRALGCKVETIKRRAPDFRFDLKELDRKLSKGADLFVVQNMNNPSGRALFEEDLRDISRVAERYRVPVLCDEVYRDFAIDYDGGMARNAFPSIVELDDRSIVTSSVTKVYGAGGLVAGWMVAPKRIADRARQLKIYTTPMVNHQGERLALEILRNRHKVMPKELSELREKLRLVSTWAKGRDDVVWSEPDGCAVGFLMYDHKVPSIDVCERLYNDYEVRCIPGAFFHQEGGFRIGAGRPYDEVKGALKRIDEYLDTL